MSLDWQTMLTKIRLRLKELSDLGLYSLFRHVFSNICGSFSGYYCSQVGLQKKKKFQNFVRLLADILTSSPGPLGFDSRQQTVDKIFMNLQVLASCDAFCFSLA